MAQFDCAGNRAVRLSGLREPPQPIGREAPTSFAVGSLPTVSSVNHFDVTPVPPPMGLPRPASMPALVGGPMVFDQALAAHAPARKKVGHRPFVSWALAGPLSELSPPTNCNMQSGLTNFPPFFPVGSRWEDSRDGSSVGPKC